MIPARLDFPCRTNADYTEELAVTDGDESVDLTGYMLAMSVRPNVNADSVFDLATVTTDVEGLRLIEAANGIIGIRMSYETLSSAYDAVVTNATLGQPVRLVYDMRLTAPSGDEDVWFVGVLTIEKGVTNG